MSFRTASIAERDIVESALWLDQQRLGAGREFISEFRQTCATIRQAPLICPIVDVGEVPYKCVLRWKPVGRFPYLAIFSFENHQILIVAVLHQNRDIAEILRTRVGT
jgi:plasmid stabilization system protein ParE